ncbi:putative FAD-binding PCMH-type domain-containing protein [Seiridium cardinale]
MERHKAAVRLISSTIRSYFERSLPYRINHGSTNSTRPAHLKKSAHLVDISALKHVLEVNKVKRTALVEPNVPMDALVAATLPYGLVPPVVMEFPGITAGGGFAGTAGESSSFRHGYFDETVKRVEMVMPDGEVVNITPEEKGKYADLWKGAVASVGTLGVTTLLEVGLVDAKKFVRTTYRRTGSVAEAIRVVKEECAKKENDYVDGILFSKDHGVIISGTMTNEEPKEGESIRTFSGPWDPWFYLHCQDITKALPASDSATSSEHATVTEHVPLAEYLFRYDRGGFWVGAAAFEYFKPVPFTRFFRWFLDDFLHTRMLYRALHSSGESAKFFVQDLALPYETAEKFIDHTTESLNIWPLWLCPLKTPAGPTFHPHLRGKGAGEMLNIGVWGWGPKDRQEFVKVNRDLEAKVNELGGMKWLYAHTYYTAREFEETYGNREWFEGLRTKYKAVSLPNVYDKVRVKDAPPEQGWKGWVKSIWPLGGLVGITRGIQSKDYMLHRNASWKWQADGKAKTE